MLNIVFDLGGVVFTWQPEEIIKRMFEDQETRDSVRSKIFAHPDWVALDKGVLDKSEAVERSVKRTSLSRLEISDLMREVPRSLVPIMHTVRLIHMVKNRGNNVFVLSNMHVASIEHIEQKYAFWDVFDGTVISCRVHMVKPEPEIYEYLLNTYGLKNDETIFIDDTDINLNTASMFGIRPIKFIDPAQCESQLKAIGCI